MDAHEPGPHEPPRAPRRTSWIERNGTARASARATRPSRYPSCRARGTFTLEVFEGETSRLHTIDEVPKVFGSSRSAEVRLSDRTVSGTHCALSVDGDRLLVRDLGSTNGTFVGCARVEQAWASAGATITIGETQIVVHAYAEEHQRASMWAKEAPLEGIAGGLARDAEARGACASALEHGRTGAHLGGDRDGQGARGPRAPRRGEASGGPVRPGERRRAPSRSRRELALRPRAGGLHRCRAQAIRSLRRRRARGRSFSTR
jgi:hypothetical protein